MCQSRHVPNRSNTRARTVLREAGSVSGKMLIYPMELFFGRGDYKWVMMLKPKGGSMRSFERLGSLSITWAATSTMLCCPVKQPCGFIVGLSFIMLQLHQ